MIANFRSRRAPILGSLIRLAVVSVIVAGLLPFVGGRADAAAAGSNFVRVHVRSCPPGTQVVTDLSQMAKACTGTDGVTIHLSHDGIESVAQTESHPSALGDGVGRNAEASFQGLGGGKVVVWEDVTGLDLAQTICSTSVTKKNVTSSTGIYGPYATTVMEYTFSTAGNYDRKGTLECWFYNIAPTLTRVGGDLIEQPTQADGFFDGDRDLLVADDQTNDLIAAQTADTDRDGLTDGDELDVYLTDPNATDSDMDGVTDGEELFVYATNPNNVDTDADGYSDGDEVAMGSNPVTPNPADGYEAPAGASVSVRVWDCATGGNAVGLTGDPEADLDALQGSCFLAGSSYDFRLTGEGYDERRTISGAEAAYIGWAGLARGVYTITESVPAGYGEPVAICEGSAPGVQYIRRNIHELPAAGGAVSYELNEAETLTCDWFNLGAAANDAVAAEPDAVADGDGQAEAEEFDGFDAGQANADSDGDGITDADELDVFGTDPSNPDTDFDGLYDWDELEVYFTDPLNADTDGDDAADGEEVYYGSDPLDPFA